MLAAVYARKSTEQNVADDARSVTRQVVLARAFAERKGWAVDESHVYVDDAVSGAEWIARDGLNRLMEATRRNPAPFDVLVCMSVDRLGREQYRLASTLLEIVEAGVRVFFYSDGTELKLDTPIAKITLSLQGYAAEDYRQQIRTKTREAMRAKAKAGFVAGGKVYGYRNERVNSHVARVIVPAEAARVQRIFQEIADGRGFARVAQGLNREGVPPPRPGHHWAMTGIRAMVFNPLYRGEVVYGRTRWQDRGGTKKKVRAPQSEWITVEAPELRIISEDQWRAAHARLDRTRQTYLRQTGGKLYGRPESGIDGRHLLSGFLVCGCCDGAMHAIKRTSQRGGPRTYFVCNNWRVNGACDNSKSVLVRDMDTSVIEALRAVLTPDLVRDVIRRAQDLGTEEPDQLEQRRRGYVEEETRLKQEIGRYVEAIGVGGSSLASVLDALQARERRRAEIQAQLEHLDGLAKTTPIRDGHLAREVRTRLEEWHALLGRNPAQARQIVRRLIVGRIKMTPKASGYEWGGQATFVVLLRGAVGLPPFVVGMVPPG